MGCESCPVREVCEEVKAEEVERARRDPVVGRAVDKVRVALSGYCPLREVAREKVARAVSEVVKVLKEVALLKDRYKVAP